MNRMFAAAAAVFAGVSLLAGTAFADPIPDVNAGKPTFTAIVPSERFEPEMLARLASAGGTIPFWRGRATSGLDGRTYTFDMVGTSPFNAPAATTIAYVPILLRVSFPGGIVLDPTTAACNDRTPVASRLFNSPLFRPVHVTSNGVDLGTSQLTDAFQRANFWTSIRGSSAYHVKFASAVGTPIVVNVIAPSGSAAQTVHGVCHKVGLIPMNAFDAIARSLAARYARPSQLAMIVTYDVVLYTGQGCCVNGYHSAFVRNGAAQTYAVGTYDDPIYNGNVNESDINAWSHELGEWYDDPFVSMDGNNLTPAWGHIGQTANCQNNLEVGDPLSGTSFYALSGGFRYHPQDLAFLSWFYRFPSIGTAGRYSFEGTFRSAPGACR